MKTREEEEEEEEVNEEEEGKVKEKRSLVECRCAQIRRNSTPELRVNAQGIRRLNPPTSLP